MDVDRLLVVEDEAPILAGLETLLRHHGFEVVTAADGNAALEQVAAGGFDLVVLDLMLPGPSGFEVLSHMRGAGDGTPVLVLTARGAETDIVEGLERGADDYVTKPFGVHELVARIKGLLRRGARAEAPARLRLGGVDLDLDGLVAACGAVRVPLTAREGALLAFLLARRHRPVGRDELLVGVWGYRDGRIETRTVDVHVQKLRKKLGALPGGEGWIVTIRGRGYRLVAEPAEA
jgi:DNA-binding response OmpR family regulator